MINPIELNKADKVRWVGSENGETFEHFGTIVEVNTDNVLFQTAYGEMNVGHNDGEFHVHIGELPLIIREVEIDHTPKADKPKGVRTGSNQHKVILLVAQLQEGLDRPITSADAVPTIMEMFGMSTAGAKTYFYNATKYIKENGTPAAE